MTQAQAILFIKSYAGLTDDQVRARLAVLSAEDLELIGELGPESYGQLQGFMPDTFGYPPATLGWDEAMSEALAIDRRRAAINIPEIRQAAQNMTEALAVSDAVQLALAVVRLVLLFV